MAKTIQSSAISSVDKTSTRSSKKSHSKEKVMEDYTKEIFVAQYKAFHCIYEQIDDSIVCKYGEKADVLYQKSKLAVVEYLTNKVNFLAKTAAGYPVNIVQSFDIHGAFEIEEGHQLLALIMVQMKGIKTAYCELAWMLGEDFVEAIDAVDSPLPALVNIDADEDVPF